MKYKYGMNLTKYVQEIYEENDKTLMKEIKEKLNKWRDISCPRIGRLNIVKMSVLPNLIQCNPNQVPGSYLVDIKKLILKCIWRGRRCRRPCTILKEKNKIRIDTTLRLITKLQ